MLTKSTNSFDMPSMPAREGDGCDLIISYKAIGLLISGYGCLPVTISYTVTPRLQISLENV
jgi:hypothetical protein